jgi:hypothetical protein
MEKVIWPVGRVRYTAGLYCSGGSDPLTFFQYLTIFQFHPNAPCLKMQNTSFFMSKKFPNLASLPINSNGTNFLFGPTSKSFYILNYKI